MSGGRYKIALVFALTLASAGCATNPHKDGEKDAELNIVSDVRSAPFVPEKARGLDEQRKIDDKRAFPEFAKLQFSSDSERAMHHFALGQAYSLGGESERAIEDYQITLVYDPNSALVHSRLAAEMVKVGRFAEAKKYCKKAVELDPKFIDGYLLLAGIHVVSKEYDEAVKIYQRVLKIVPQHRDALLYYGTTLAEAGRLDSALEVLERLVKLEDDGSSQVDSATAWYYLGKVEAQREKFPKAVKALEQSLKARPEFAKSALLLSDIYLAQDQQDKAIKTLEESFKENSNPGIAARLAAFSLAKSQFKRAVPYLETVVENDADNMSARVRLALVYWQIDWLDKAYDTLAEVKERFPESNEVIFYLGELELERKRPEQAYAQFASIGSEYPRYEEAVGKAVAALLQTNRRDSARGFVEAALVKKPEIVSFYTSYARLLEEDGKFAQAIQFLEGHRNRLEADEGALYYLGYLYDRVGSKKQGLALMEKILVMNPENANALNYLGYSLLEDGKDMDRAERLIVKALELKPNDPYILDSYGWLLFRRGNPAGAIKQIERAVELKPEEGVILEHLADVYMEQNLKRKAMTAYEKALERLQDPKEQARVQEKLNSLVAGGAVSGERRLPASKASKKRSGSVNTAKSAKTSNKSDKE